MNGHCNHLALKFSVCVKERQDRLPTMYWLPKLHKRPYKARFIANSSSCTTTELSKLLTSCLTAVKNHVIRYCEKVYERSDKNLFWSIKNSDEVLNKLKSEMRSFKSNENIHKKEGGSYYVVSANKASSVTLQSPGNESQRKHTAILRISNRQSIQRLI